MSPLSAPSRFPPSTTWALPGKLSNRPTPLSPEATLASRTGPPRPFFTPETRTGSPSFRPFTFLKTTLTGTDLDTSERPVSQNMKPVNTANPTSTSRPTRTSCLYVMSTRASSCQLGLRVGLDQRHLEITLQELLHRRIL